MESKNKDGYKRLIVWQKADELAYQVYLATKTFQKEELFGMTSQLRRSALSVPANIVEGFARQSDNEFRRFVNIALGSLAETEYYLGFTKRLGLLRDGPHEKLRVLRQEVGALLWKFRKAV